MVTHPSHLWAIHYRRPAEQRCTYEVIASGSPCKLYMDLEFNKILNPLCDGNKMTNILVRATVWLFQELFDLTLSPSDVLILDACTASKFSQHLIFQTGCIAFQDNIHAGSFVKHLVSLLKDGKIPILEPEDQQSLFVRNSEGSNSNDVPPTSSFCDLAVYTKNRNFRLFLSSKFGKNVPLLVSSTNLYVPDSQVCGIKFVVMCRTDLILKNSAFSIQGFSDADEAIFYSSLVSLINPGIGQLLSFTGDVVDRPYSSAPSMRALVDSTSLPSSSGLVSRSSPWVEIDRFVDSLVLPFGGSIRQWIYYEKSQTVVYLIQGSRYCSVIGRHHKSNSVKYVVNLTHGTYYQSCFDPDCAPMRPSPQPIPAEHLPWSNLLQSPEQYVFTDGIILY